MIKVLACMALLFAVLVVARGVPFGGPGGSSRGCSGGDGSSADGPSSGGPRFGGSSADGPSFGGSSADGPRPSGPYEGGPRPGGPHEGDPRPGGDGFKGQALAKLCANQTTANSLVTQIQQLINTLQSNGSFVQVLADRAQEVAYIQNSANTALLSSNCTGYFHGLENAQNADRVALEAKQQYYRIAAEAMMSIIRSLLGGSKYRNGA